MDDVVIKGHAIDQTLLRRRAIARCELASCQAACCSRGVWVDHDAAMRILADAALIQPFMPEDRRDTTNWFAELRSDDPAFPSGRYTGTTTVTDATHPNGTTCVFLRPEDRRCAIQTAFTAADFPPAELKPFYCALFPLVDEHLDEHRRPLAAPRLMLDDHNVLFGTGGGCYEDGGNLQFVFQIYAEEVALVLGVDGYRDLCAAMDVAPRL
jgi:Fe-S-cluster containining protein